MYASRHRLGLHPNLALKLVLNLLPISVGYYGESNWECTLIDAMIDACEEFNQPTDAIFHTDDPEKVGLMREGEIRNIALACPGLISSSCSWGVLARISD